MERHARTAGGLPLPKGSVLTLLIAEGDCDAAPIRPRGTPCEVSLVAGDRLVLRWDSRLKQGVPKRHNIFSVPYEAAFDQCLIADAEEVGGGKEDFELTETVFHDWSGTVGAF